MQNNNTVFHNHKQVWRFKMKKYAALLWMSVLSAFLIFTACSSNEQLTTPDNNTSDEGVSLDKEFGGYTTEDEDFAFGEADLAEEFPADIEAADPVAADPEVAAVLSSDTDAGMKAYFLRVTFGLLEGDSTATEVIDWSGSAEVSKGTLVVLKTIRFENGDYIVRPRSSRQAFDFVAFTKPHFDGFALAIIDNDTTNDGVEGTFTITAGSYTKTLSFSELDSLELLEPVGSNGHEVSIVSRSRDVVPFAGGFLAGRWAKTREQGGVFRGRWINSIGTNAGFLRGIWGINRGGEKVFKGKYISMNGRFGGLLAGHWEYRDDETSGVFKGRWVNRAHDTVGVVKGHFKTGRANDRRGYFHGRYEVTNKDNATDTQ